VVVTDPSAKNRNACPPAVVAQTPKIVNICVAASQRIDELMRGGF
jgi:hypothetical protein